MNTETLKTDIPLDFAQRAFYGVSFHAERRGETAQNDYAQTLASDYAEMVSQSVKGHTENLLAAEFERYRNSYRKKYMAYLHSNSRCVSWFIAGPSNFPAARMNKRADICHKRLNELIEFRARALAAIRRTLRPDLAPIYSSDENALERLEIKIIQAESLQARMKATNATIRKSKKGGEAKQVEALLAMGYGIGTARELLKPDFCGRIGFADYELTNNGANIHRMKQRLEHITRLKETPASEVNGEHARFEDVPAENRVRLWFPGKPDEATRTKLKSNGFRWTPSLGCWQAYRNYRATIMAKEIAGVTQQAAA